jgi:hypothetical protein
LLGAMSPSNGFDPRPIDFVSASSALQRSHSNSPSPTAGEGDPSKISAAGRTCFQSLL